MRRKLSRMLHRAIGLLMGGLAALVLATGLVAWRLSEGPISLRFLVPTIEAALNEDGGRTRLRIEYAELAWEGWHRGVQVPLDIRMRGMRMVDAAGAVIAELQEAAITLSMRALLRGEIEPRTVVLMRPAIRVVRAEDGALSVDLGDYAATGPEGAAADPDLADRLVEGLLRPPGERSGALTELRRVVVQEARVVLVDRQLGVTWTMPRADLDLQRDQSGISGIGALLLALDGTEAAIAATARFDRARRQFEVALDVDGLAPPRLAATWPALSVLSGLEAAAAATVRLEFDERLGPRAASFALRLGGGTVRPAGSPAVGPLRFEGGFLEGRAEDGFRTLRVERAELRLPAAGAAPGPLLTGTLRLVRTAEGQVFEAGLGFDEVALDGLDQWWPQGLHANVRAWLVANIADGTARDGWFRFGGLVAASSGGVSVNTIEGGLSVGGATVHWLRPVPPVTGVSGEVHFFSDRVEIDARGGEQGRLRLGAAKVVIDDFYQRVESLAVEVRLGGPVAEAMALLQHPRLRLRNRVPAEVSAATGEVEASLTVRLALLADLGMDDVRIAAAAKVSQVRLPGVALGRDLDRASLDLAVDNDGVTAAGTGSFAGVPVRLRVERDFRAGGAQQVLERVSVIGRASQEQLAALGYDPAPWVAGAAGIEIAMLARRNGAGEIALRADLADASIAIDDLGYAKAPGAPGRAELTLRLRNGRLVAGDGLRVQAEGFDLAGKLDFADRRLARIEIASARVGASRFSGEVRMPAENQYEISLRGAVADLRARFGHAAREAAAREQARPAEPAAPPEIGPRLGLEARFDRVILSDTGELRAVVARARHDGRVLGTLDLRARVGEEGSLAMTIGPAANGRARTLRMQSDNAGDALRAFDVARHFRGGKLNLEGRFDDADPASPLTGEAVIEDFRIGDAPALARLASAISLVGVLDMMAGPGIGFARLTAPFTLTGDILELRDARVWGPSLGLTGRGRVDLARRTIAADGTIVPAYMVNAILGNIPLIGQLFSPERGGGVFAASFRLSGPLDNPQTTVNPLSLLTPGFLRRIFDIGEGEGTAPATPPQASPPQASPPQQGAAPAAPAAPPAPAAPAPAPVPAR